MGLIIHEKKAFYNSEIIDTVMKNSRINQCNTIHLFKLKAANL